MPSGKSRSKDDTWKADELQKSLKEARADKPDRRKHRDGDDKEKRHRRREDDEGKERRHRDKEINGDDKERKHRKREGGEDEKERRRRPKEDDEKRRNKENEGGDDEKRRRHLEKDGGGEEGERRRKRPEGADEDGERRRRHRDKEGGDDEERKRKHREKEGGEDEERRRKHREKDGDDKERRRKPRDEDGAGERSRRRKDGEEDEERRRRRKEKEGEDDGKKDGDDERRRKRREKDGEDDEERRRRRKEREGDDEGRRKHRDDRRKEKDGEEEGKEDGKEKEERRRRRTEEGDEDREERRRHRKEEGDEDREERRRRRKEEGGDEDKEERRRRRKEEGDDEGRRRRHKEKDGEDGERRRRHRDKEGSGSRQRPKEGESEDGRQEGETETQETNGNENNQLDAVDSGPPPPADIHSEDQLAVAAKGPSEEKEEETKPKEVKEKTKPEKEPKKEVKHSGSKKITKPASKSSRSVTTRKTSTKVAVTSPVKAKTQNSSVKSSAEAKVEADGGDDYGDYEDDFEDYDDDFEDEDEEQEDNQLKKSREEMDDLFQAMNEENDRLLASSRDFSDSTDLSDERSKPSRPVTGHQRKFINFVSAKQRQVTAKTASKTRRRGQELLQLIEFDSVQFNLFDMPPVNEYELYMRSFGSSNTKQTYVQTNDDNLDREIQTEEIDNKQKWTQHPPEDFAGCGGDDNDDEEDQMSKGLDSVKLSKFLQRATQTILILLEEDYTERSQNEVKESQSSASFSQGFLQLETAPIVQGRHVTYSCFSPVQTNLLLTIHSQPSKEYDVSIDRRGFIYVWNINEPSRPIKYLVCESQPTCCCFSPSKATLVFAGMNDGTLVVWDLRETSSLHHTLRLWNEEWLIRNPTYSTAGVIGDENHHSAITTVLPIVSTADSAMSSLVSNEDVGSGLSFQLASLEENSIMHLWVVAEVAVPDSAGSESDLGLSPGGRIKLLKSSSVTLQHPSGRDSRLKATLRSFHMQLLPSNPNHYYVGTDSGMILHGTRHSGKVVPKAYKQEIDSPVSVTSIDFSPFDVSCFLAGCADGSLRIYNLTTELPAVVWPNSTNGQPIVSVQWSRSRPCVFYVLDKDSKFHIWDLSQNDAMPVKVEHFTSGRLTSFSLSNDHRATGLGLLGSRPKMVLCFDDGKTELHTVSEALGHLQPNEVEHLKNYIESAL